MLALYRCDRQSEALQAYQDARRLLVEELGLEPSRRLRDLEQAILRQDPALDIGGLSRPGSGASDVGRETSAVRAGGIFVGRENELRALVRAVGAALAGWRTRVVIGRMP